MALANRLLGSLRVANPCSASWEQMIGDDRVRYCTQCELHVYNLEALTEEEIAALIEKKQHSRVCARLYARQDGKVLTQDCPVGQRIWRRRLAILVAPLVVVMAACFGTLFIVPEGDDTLKAKPRKQYASRLRQKQPLKAIFDWIDPPPPPPPLAPTPAGIGSDW